MKHIYPLILFTMLILHACEKEGPLEKQYSESELRYDYKIIYHASTDKLQTDSIIYYYDSNDRLVYVDEGGLDSEYFPVYTEDYIQTWNGRYHFDSEDSIVRFPDAEIIVNGNETIIHKQFVNNDDQLYQEDYLFFEDNVHSKDSTIIYDQEFDRTYRTVSMYSYTDIEVPFFKVHYSGLHEYPKYSKYLKKEIKNIHFTDLEMDNTYYLTKFNYTLTDNKLVETARGYDVHPDTTYHHLTDTRIYELVGDSASTDSIKNMAKK